VPDKERYPGPPGWRFSVGLISSLSKTSMVSKATGRPWPGNGTAVL